MREIGKMRGGRGAKRETRKRDNGKEAKKKRLSRRLQSSAQSSAQSLLLALSFNGIGKNKSKRPKMAVLGRKNGYKSAQISAERTLEVPIRGH